jgi:hypothetical protein
LASSSVTAHTLRTTPAAQARSANSSSCANIWKWDSGAREAPGVMHEDACAVVDMDAVFDAVLDALVPMPRRRGVRRARGVLGTTTTRDAIY